MWCAWTAVLAAMPYGVWSFGPMVPGQIGIAAFSFAVIVFVAASMLTPRLGDQLRSAIARARVIVMRMGCAATAVLAVAEVYAFMRGNAGLEAFDQVALNNVMSLVEFVCSIIAVACWTLSSVGLESAPTSHSRLRSIVLFAAGGILPAACALVATIPGFDSPPAEVALCIAVFVLALLCVRRLGARVFSVWEVSTLLAGHMTFLSFRSLVGEYRSDLLDAGLPNAALFVLFLAFVTVFSLAWSLWALWGGKKKEEESGPSVCVERWEGEGVVSRDCTERRMERYLSGWAHSPLTDRETAVLARTALGYTAASIAAELGIAQATVATYRRRGYEKLGLGGAEELRNLALGLGSDEGPSDLEEVAPFSDKEGAACKLGSLAPQIAAFVCLVLVMVLNAPHDVLLGEHWFRRGTFYLAWAVACALAVSSCVRMTSHGQEALSPQDVRNLPGVGNSIVTASVPFVLVCLLSVGAFCGWSGAWVCKIMAPVLLAVASLVVGRESLSRVMDDCPPWRILFAGFGILLASPLLPLLASAVISATYCLELYCPGLATEVVFALSPLLIFVGAAALVYQSMAAAIPVVEPMDKEYDRAIHYLQGRGVDGLRAQIVLDLVCGYSALEVCKRRCTTLATIKSYRQRTYADCNVHRMEDLRKLLVDEAKFTSLSRLHPPK